MSTQLETGQQIMASNLVFTEMVESPETLGASLLSPPTHLHCSGREVGSSSRKWNDPWV